MAENLFGQEPWERRGTAQTAAVTAVSAALPVGMITAYWGTTAPAGWLLCDGAAIPAQYSALIALVGANTPNLKGRVIVGIDAAQTEFDALGETGGAKTHVLTTNELVSHAHSFTTDGQSATHNHGGSGFAENAASGAAFTAATLNGGAHGWVTGNASGDHSHNGTTNAFGNSAAHNNLQPYAALSYIIKAT